MGYRFINIVLMTKYEYIKSFGVGELDNIEERRYKIARFSLIKLKRSLKECFLYLDHGEMYNL